MGKLVLVNDVQNKIAETGLIVGTYDASVNAEGAAQADKLAKLLCDKIGRISLVITSDMSRSKKILNRIRYNALDEKKYPEEALRLNINERTNKTDSPQ